MFLVSRDVPVIGGYIEVDRCTSTVRFAFWTVVGVDAWPDFPCCDTMSFVFGTQP
jgi:hypothetical protein